ncbi:MAG: hypothetical protein M4D80_27385 [Myxococcota bacterium]|nr:hypothetical protein [Deltaproteobacteria bacterium]MDQ3338904.1 hypothetical protein [Myxococcota bacterium]
MKISSYLVASLLALTAACGGGGKKSPPDAPPPPPVDGPPPCSAPASFTTAMELELFYNPDSQNMVTGNQELWRTIGTLDTTMTQDWLWIELFEGPAPDYTTENFPAAPFTINLAGNELDYIKCSTCVTLTTDVNVANTAELEYLDDYMATAGSVMITTLTPTMIAGTLTNINFAHVDISMAGTVPNASGCSSTLASLPFTAMVTPMANGKMGAKVGLPSLTAKRPLR